MGHNFCFEGGAQSINGHGTYKNVCSSYMYTMPAGRSSSWLNAVLAERHCTNYTGILIKHKRKANNYNRYLGFSKDYRLSR